MIELRVGQIIDDKYTVDSLLGSGGMGLVVAATHVELGQRVAIKLLQDVRPHTVARFQREGRFLVRLKSPHVARVFDVGVLDDDTPFIVMEHLEGRDLESLAKAGRLPYGEVVDYVLQACDAIAEAHALGMVHRDIKPANLFLAKGPGGAMTIKVLDFGVSKILDARASVEEAPGVDLTTEGTTLGSPGYMSPEQITDARDADVRSDVFSLGAVMYSLVAGVPAYDGTSALAILAAMTKPLARLSAVVPDVPPKLALVIERCLAQDREARWPTVAHLAQALEPFATARGRLYVEQISRTLGVTSFVDGVETLALPPPQLHTVAMSGSGSPRNERADTRIATLASPGVTDVRASSFTPGGGQPAEAPRGNAKVVVALVGLFAVALGGAAWAASRAARTSAPPGEAAAGAPSGATAASATAGAAPIVPAASTTPPSAASAVAAVAASETPMTSEPTTRPRPKAPPSPPRPMTGSAPLDPSKPPSAANMPPSRR